MLKKSQLPNYSGDSRDLECDTTRVHVRGISLKWLYLGMLSMTTSVAEFQWNWNVLILFVINVQSVGYNNKPHVRSADFHIKNKTFKKYISTYSIQRFILEYFWINDLINQLL